ncbi:hypothetical protein AB0G64_37490 [Streptomyces longwoodensis]|uniref:hypothetical protein n=1 Tax=Streptomyces longwoodensis TaxID=68231 RepID=UPI0033FDDF33
MRTSTDANDRSVTRLRITSWTVGRLAILLGSIAVMALLGLTARLTAVQPKFSDGVATFVNVECSGGGVSFVGATFSGGEVSLDGVTGAPPLGLLSAVGTPVPVAPQPQP